LVLIVATAAGLALAGYLINTAGVSEPAGSPAPVQGDDPRSRQVHQSFQQAVAMLHARNYEYAVQSLHEVLAVQPRMPEAHANMGFALLGLGMHMAARDFFESATDLRPSQYNAYYGLAVANEDLGNVKAAVAAMQTYVHLAPADDPYRRKAEAAIWEWESKMKEDGS